MTQPPPVLHCAIGYWLLAIGCWLSASNDAWGRSVFLPSPVSHRGPLAFAFLAALAALHKARGRNPSPGSRTLRRLRPLRCRLAPSPVSTLSTRQLPVPR